MGLVRLLVAWVYDRLQLQPIVEKLLHHEIPPETAWTRKGWLYVFGNAILATFILQVVTGTALVTKYIPSPRDAYASLIFINEEVWLGWFLRALHFYGGSAMVLLVFLHMCRVFLTGAYKFPRELNWVTGAVLFFLVMGMAFTGQLLRWDQDGVWTVVVASKFVGRAPLIGEHLMELILAGETLGGATLSRFFALHVIILPLLIMAVVAIHIYLVFRNGISEPPVAGRPVDPATYRAWYHRHVKGAGARYWPDAAWRELVAITLVFAGIFGLALVFGPKGPGLPPDPTQVAADPRPDWFLIWYYTLIWLKPRGWDDLVMVYLPMVAGFALLLLPLVRNRGERAPSRRPWAVALVGVVVISLALLISFGLRPYWVPDFGTEPMPRGAFAQDQEFVYEGASIFYTRGCQYCHFTLDRGGRYGPDLTHVVQRLSRQEITVRTVQGIRNMPAYRDVLTPGELERIIAYLEWVNLHAR